MDRRARDVFEAAAGVVGRRCVTDLQEAGIVPVWRKDLAELRARAALFDAAFVLLAISLRVAEARLLVSSRRRRPSTRPRATSTRRPAASRSRAGS